MSMFTLAISCLTMSNSPWFLDPTFQIPMQYCSLKHQTLLSPPDTSTTEHCFCFGPAASFFLELFIIALCYSPVAHWKSSELISVSYGRYGAHLPVSYLFAFSYCWWDSLRKNTGVVGHFLLQWTVFHQNCSLWPSLCCGPAWYGS